MNPDRRRRRRQIWTAGIAAALACVVITWSFTLWPGAALICGAVTGPVAALLYAVVYDAVTRR
jgi:hypothetical protein